MIMSTSLTAPALTISDFLTLPENDGVDRELIAGELREKPMTRRNRRHTRTSTLLAHFLQDWLQRQPQPRGEVLTGDAAFRLARNPDSVVGIDLAYISAEVASQTPDNVSVIDGIPILTVEILSPSDKHEEIVEKIELYLQSGVQLVWVVDPDLRTVSVHRPDAAPALFNHLQELTAEPHLPGFCVPVAELFQIVG